MGRTKQGQAPFGYRWQGNAWEAEFGGGRLDGHKGLRLAGWERAETERRWVVVALADDAGCGKVPDSDPMSAMRRDFPGAGTVVRLSVGKGLRACGVRILEGSREASESEVLVFPDELVAATTEPPPVRTAWDVQWPLPLPVSQP